MRSGGDFSDWHIKSLGQRKTVALAPISNSDYMGPKGYLRIEKLESPSLDFEVLGENALGNYPGPHKYRVAN